ncbi:MAG TPA: hypothetical protein VMU22_00505 [Rhizomicrobium sp.]|nr:hypothetical protein [Rhizomicrobium sp.]
MTKGTRIASKIGALGMAACFVAASTGDAWARCAAPQEMTALRAAALRQHLMVAGLVCHEADSFNRFIIAYQSEFQESDRALMAFFNRQGSGEAGYNAYKTREANDSSLRSTRDGRFCEEAEAAFYIALHRGLALAQLASYEAPILHTGYQSCSRSAELYDASFASPALPARHEDLMEAAAAPEATAPAAAAPAAAAPTPIAAPPAQEKFAALPETAPPAATTPAQDESAAPDDADQMPDPQPAENTYARSYAYNGYSAPYGYNPYYSRWYPYAPPMMRQVMGPDGRWYLVPSYVR